MFCKKTQKKQQQQQQQQKKTKKKKKNELKTHFFLRSKDVPLLVVIFYLK